MKNGSGQSAVAGAEVSADAVASKVRGILEAAERAAEGIRREAMADAARMRRDADIAAAAALADARRRAEELLRTELETASRLTADIAGQARDWVLLLDRAASLRDELEPALRRLEESSAELPDASEVARVGGFEAADTSPLGEARLMALEMAMAGRARGEVEDQLSHGLHVGDPQEILDDIFGRGSGRDSRLQWSHQDKGSPEAR